MSANRPVVACQGLSGSTGNTQHRPEHTGADQSWRMAALCILLTGFGWITSLLFFCGSESNWQAALADGLQSHDVSTVAKLSANVFHTRVGISSPYSIALLAEAAALRSENDTALRLYDELPRDGDRWEFIAERGKARRYEVLGRLQQAEKSLRRALQLSPDAVDVLEQLGNLLQVEGRTWEAAPYFLRQIQLGKCRGDELLGAASPENFFRQDKRLEQLAQDLRPPENMIYLALARRAAADDSAALAKRYLDHVLSTNPDSGEAQGRLGRLVVDRDDLSEFLHWRGALSDEARQHPEVWYVQGLRARRDGQFEGAVRCFLEVLERAPNHVASTLQLASCLQQLGRTADAQACQQRGEWLSELDQLLNRARSDSDRSFYPQLIALTEKLGREWEAAGWAYVLQFLPVDSQLAKQELRRTLHTLLSHSLSTAQNPQKLPEVMRQRSQFALPRWDARSPMSTQPSHRSKDSIPWQFEDVASQVGIDFRYYEGTTEENRLEHIFNVMGGGLGAFDYDGDGWPDLYYAQAHQWRDPKPQPEHFDRLFQNQTGERFTDVTAQAGLGDLLFSHGVAIGDFDQDGWPDIYVGNLGPNRLYHNNGDGTFTEVAATAGVAGDEWTTSSVFADFNNDGLPDLYVLNYTKKDETANRHCMSGDQERACTPDVLTAEDHRCYVNLGDGRFRDVTQDSGILGAPGKGLGVVSWDYARDGRIGLFIANDTTPNFFFVNQGSDASGTPRFHNEAVVRGVAYDMDGNVQASMGVAAGDINGDGRIDLFITDFFGAANALYCQGPDGFFDDRSRAFNIHEPSLTMLGFGCQFADLDGDGWLDVIITNGHVDQVTAKGGPDRMPPQIYRNVNGQRFELIPAAELGPFFQGAYLGRGLATLDWNRDGRTDFATSHLQAPSALVTNRTTSTSRSLVVKLLGRRGTREPTGATVTWVGSQPLQARLQTGGDGFLVTNEHRHQFAIPQNLATVRLQVRWPDGHAQDFAAVRSGSEVLLMEDRPDPYILRTFAE